MNTAADKVHGLVVTYSAAAGDFENLTLLGAIPSGPDIFGHGFTETVDVIYKPPIDLGLGTVQQFSFTVPLPIGIAASDVKIDSAYYVETGGVHVAPTERSITFSSVPEPSSIALLSIGMATFFAFRHRARRRRAAT
jgi:hypothetical protein